MIQRTQAQRTHDKRGIINQRAEPTLISINNHTDTNEFGEIGECQGRERTDKNCYLSLFMDLASCSFSSLTHQLHHIICQLQPSKREKKCSHLIVR